MSEVERSGSRNRAIARVESRTALASRRQGSRLDALEAGQTTFTLDLTTTPQNVEHGLKGSPLSANEFNARVGANNVPIEWSGAYVVRRESSGLGNLITTSTPNDKTWIGLSLESGSGTVTVVVF